MTMDSSSAYSSLRLKKETADRLRLEAARLTASTSQRWTLDRVINALLDGQKASQPENVNAI